MSLPLLQAIRVYHLRRLRANDNSQIPLLFQGGTVWPHIQGFWALAALKAGRPDLFSRELFTLAGHAVRDGQFAEIYHPEDGRIYGGIQEGGGEYLEWRSCEKQTWSAAAFLAMVFRGIFGLGAGGVSFLPKGVSHAELSGLRAGGRDIHLIIERKEQA